MTNSVKDDDQQIKKLLKKITCPHCLHIFGPEEILWVSVHSDLRGDARLDPPGAPPYAYFRFLPTRFDLDGNAIDARGQSCHDLACPRCHLVIPWPLIDTPCLVFAIFGSPGSGKSFLLASMSWTLRQSLHKMFGLDFGDADPQSNATLNQYEESLFFRQDSDKPVPVRDLIRKTQYTESSLFDTVYIGSQELKYPKPFLFEIKAGINHPDWNALSGNSRIVCLYDSAGESFQALSDDNDRLVTTAYLATARALIFLFDPMQDPRFVSACRKVTGDSVDLGVNTAIRQDTVLRETAARVRRLMKLKQGALHDRPLIVVVNKWDVWRPLVQIDPSEKPIILRKGRTVHSLDKDRLEEISATIRELLLAHCPEIVSSAEAFCRKVIYIPASALGHTPTPNPDHIDPVTGQPVTTIRPSQIDPWWTDLPLVYVISREAREFVESVRRPSTASN